MRIHQIPVGICRTIITSNKPAGNARSIATVIGEKFGRYWGLTLSGTKTHVKGFWS